MASLPVSLLDWKPLVKNSLRGFAGVRVGKTLILRDVSVHCANGRRWAMPAAKPQMSADGTVRRDEKGKIKYVPIVEWATKEAADAFSESVIEAIEREHPNATSDTAS